MFKIGDLFRILSPAIHMTARMTTLEREREREREREKEREREIFLQCDILPELF